MISLKKRGRIIFKQNSKKNMMRVKITTTLWTDKDNLWAEIEKVSSLLYVASPIIIFKPQKGCSLPERWQTGIEYCFNLLLLGFIPLGRHYITLVKIDRNTNIIKSHEHSRIINLWVHTITIKENSTDDIDYTDEVEIDAGVFTLPVWLFSHLFYRYRQYRWRIFFGD